MDGGMIEQLGRWETAEIRNSKTALYITSILRLKTLSSDLRTWVHCRVSAILLLGVSSEEVFQGLGASSSPCSGIVHQAMLPPCS